MFLYRHIYTHNDIKCTWFVHVHVYWSKCVWALKSKCLDAMIHIIACSFWLRLFFCVLGVWRCFWEVIQIIMILTFWTWERGNHFQSIALFFFCDLWGQHVTQYNPVGCLKNTYPFMIAVRKIPPDFTPRGCYCRCWGCKRWDVWMQMAHTASLTLDMMRGLSFGREF